MGVYKASISQGFDTRGVRHSVALYLYMIAAGIAVAVLVALLVLPVCPLLSVNSLVPAGLTPLLSHMTRDPPCTLLGWLLSLLSPAFALFFSSPHMTPARADLWKEFETFLSPADMTFFNFLSLKLVHSPVAKTQSKCLIMLWSYMCVRPQSKGVFL